MADIIHVQVLNRLKTLIAADFSSGFSGFDLSDRVVLGAVIHSPQVPSASIVFVDTIEQQGRTLGRYIGESVYQIVCYAGGSNLESRIQNAMNLAGDIQKAITSDRTLGLSGLTQDVIVNFTALDGEEYGISNTGISLLEVRVSHQSQFGV
tara:strand:+ start:2269 stop:2721 length:453 start_codon:yes stop_codon:yes gene_type:complete